VCSFGSAQAITVQFDQPATTLQTGAPFSLTVLGFDFPATIGGGIDLSFDPAIINISAVTMNTAVFPFSDAGTIDNVAGTLTDAYFNSLAAPSGTLEFMTIDFIAMGAGSTQLSLSEGLLAVFADVDANQFGSQIQFIPASVTVTAVPVPAATWLMLSGLGLISAVARKGRQVLRGYSV